MNIAIVAPRIWDTIFLDQAEVLARQGHAVSVYTEDARGASGAKFVRMCDQGIDFWIIHHEKRNPWVWLLDRLAKPWLGRRFFTSLVAVIRYLWRHRQVDVVLVEGDWAGVFVAAARCLMSFRWVVSVHDTLSLPIRLDYPGRNVRPLHARLKMWVLRKADVIRANSPVTRDALIEAGCDPARIVTVPLHVTSWMRLTEQARDLATWRASCRRRIGGKYDLPADARIAITMSRLTPVKGLELAVEALAACGAPELHLLICGGDRDIPGLGSYSAHLARLAERLGVGGRVLFCGDVPVTEVKDYLAAADVHLAPSLMDTFNYAVIEAALVATPSVMSDKVGASPWIVELGGGRIVTGRDGMAWAQGIEAALHSPLPMDGSVGERCLKRFSPERIARELLEAVAPTQTA